MNATLRNVLAARELGIRASVIALVVVAAGTATNATEQWTEKRRIAANHRQAGWQ